MIEVGRIQVHTLNDGFIALDGGAMFGIVPKALWQKHVPTDAENRITMSLHCPLAVDGRDVVLVDTGVGERLSERERQLYKADRRGGLPARLRELGLAPEDVTHVILTHLHFDHAGGLIARGPDGTFQPAFPRARHFVQRRELADAEHPCDERAAAAYRHVPECLAPLRTHGLLEVLDGATAITPRLRVEVTGGHTPGHQCPIFTDAGNTFVHLADVAPTRAHLRPAWNQSYDLDPAGTIAAKRALLERAASERWWISFDHDHEIGCAKLAESWRKSGETVDGQRL